MVAASDTAIRETLADAELPCLLSSLAFATGDLSLLKAHLQVDPLLAGEPQGGLTEAQQAEAQAGIARTNLQRSRELVAQNFVSQSAVDHSRLREYLSSLNNDLERYARIFELETAHAERKLDIIHCLSVEERVIPAYDSLACGMAHRLEQVVFDTDARHLTVSAEH